MSKTNHNKRKDYEDLYKRLCNEADQQSPNNLQFLSDYQLLQNMNVILINKNCIPFTNEELEMELA